MFYGILLLFLECGGLQKSVKGIITSPNYPNNYDNNMECLWIIEVPATHTINLAFVDVDIAKSWIGNCSDVVNVRYKIHIFFQ